MAVVKAAMAAVRMRDLIIMVGNLGLRRLKEMCVLNREQKWFPFCLSHDRQRGVLLVFYLLFGVLLPQPCRA